MSVNAKNPNTLIVATTNGLYRSTDGGIAFVALGGSKFPNASRVSVAISPSDTNRVYALFSTFGGQGGNNLAEIYVSKDGGNAWTLSKKNLMSDSSAIRATTTTASRSIPPILRL